MVICHTKYRHPLIYDCRKDDTCYPVPSFYCSGFEHLKYRNGIFIFNTFLSKNELVFHYFLSYTFEQSLKQTFIKSTFRKQTYPEHHNIPLCFGHDANTSNDETRVFHFKHIQ